MVESERDSKGGGHPLEDDELDRDSFAALVEQSLSGLEEGEVVTGRVVEITPISVVVDIGYKAEGEIPIEEFLGALGEVSVKPGDEIEVVIESHFMDGEEEVVLLSHRRAGEAQAWERIAEACRADGTISGTIVGRVKGGFRVDTGVSAFLPGSQVDLRPVRDVDSLLGRTLEFKILKYSRRRRNVVLSRRAILEEQRRAQKDQLLAALKEGQVVKGVVKNVVKYGAFIDLGGMDGLLHVSDMSWGRIQHPSDLVKVGDEMAVMILKFDRQRERISLGLKQLHPDPWSEAAGRYQPGVKVKGRVVNVVDYGAFVEIEPGLEGLIHITEMSWSGNVRPANKMLREGELVEAVVLSLEAENRKLALSLKRTQPDPWPDLAQRFPSGTVVEGAIQTVTDFGVFISLAQGIDGLVHRKDITWDIDPPSPQEVFRPGQVIKAQVLSVDMDNRRVALGLKQLTPNPWPQLNESISVGAVLTGKVTSLTEAGALVEVAEGVRGSIDAAGDGRSVQGELNVGQEVQVQVVEVEPERRRLALALVPLGPSVASPK